MLLGFRHGCVGDRTQLGVDVIRFRFGHGRSGGRAQPGVDVSGLGLGQDAVVILARN